MPDAGEKRPFRLGAGCRPPFSLPLWLRGLPLLLILALLPLAEAASADSTISAGSEKTGYSFSVASDQRHYAGSGAYDSRDFFRGAVEASAGGGAFMLGPGDIDPPASSAWTIAQVLGRSFQWFPVVGNHELPGQGTESFAGENLQWLRNFDYDRNGPGNPPDLVNRGPAGCPETTYSFDYLDSHFVILNVYCDTGGDEQTQGDIPDHLYHWLEMDLHMTDRPRIFVAGHEPAFPQPDLDNGRLRHADDSLNANPANRDRFWRLLADTGVIAYFCGHTHNFSVIKVDGVWQIDAGHARGRGDIGAASTFLRVDAGAALSLAVHRDTHDGDYDYQDLIYRLPLAGTPIRQRTLSFQNGLLPRLDYDGAKDTSLSEYSPTATSGGAATLVVDADEPQGSGMRSTLLLAWDISAIPPGSVVHSATISLTISDGTDRPLGLQALISPWSESEANWYRADSRRIWSGAGASGPLDRAAELIAFAIPPSGKRFTFPLNRAGLARVQAWVDDPAGNHGIVFSTSATDGVSIAASESANPAYRPRLTVSYTPAPRQGPLPWLPLLLSGQTRELSPAGEVSFPARTRHTE